MADNVDSGKKKPSRAVPKVGKEVKAQPVKRTSGAVGKPKVADEEARKLKEQVEALRKLPQSADATAAKRVVTLEEQNKRLTTRLNGVVAENRRLSESIEPVKKDLERCQEHFLKLEAELATARKQKKTADETLVKLEKTMKRLQSQNKHLESQLAANNAALQESGKVSLLATDTVAGMIADLNEKLRDAMSGLDVKGMEVKLKVAFGGAGDKSGFFLPTIDSGPEIGDKLSEVIINFDRSGLEARDTSPD